MRERRSTIRIPVGVEGTYELAKGLSGPRLALAQDVSLGGMRLVAAEHLQPGDRVQISVSLPLQGAVTIRGVVVWAHEANRAGQVDYECGLRWMEIHPASQARVNAFITGHTRTELTPQDFAGIVLTPVVRWSRVAFGSFVVAGLLVAAALYWIEWVRISNEVKALRQQVSAYQALLVGTVYSSPISR